MGKGKGKGQGVLTIIQLRRRQGGRRSWAPPWKKELTGHREGRSSRAINKGGGARAPSGREELAARDTKATTTSTPGRFWTPPCAREKREGEREDRAGVEEREANMRGGIGGFVRWQLVGKSTRTLRALW